ncbi:hypothetical protein [Arcanobacterium phocae]|uniref:hypothetical protein n=1 Tax=Arcanobacterium phocae TaxID=131112 RepID=UPI001C0F2C0A|nr:hypothetical protein [Arcanobacterium phocae]
MGLFTTNSRDIARQVKESFGDTDSYLVVLKHNSVPKGLLKLLLSVMYFVVDSSREFILYFDEKGVHEKEFGFSDGTQFLLIPWHEIDEFSVEERRNKSIIRLTHLGKEYSYEVHYSGNVTMSNQERLQKLVAKSWHKIK